MTLVETPTDQTSLVQGLEYVHGSSDVAKFMNSAVIRQANLVPYDVTTEIYRGEHDGITQIGAVATKYYDPAIARTRQRNFVAGEAYESQLDISALHEQYTSQAAHDVVEVMGLKSYTTEGSDGKVVTEILMPDRAADWNANLKKLGITDREFADFEGEKFTLVEQLSALVNRKILLATGHQEGIHDRATHSMSYVFASPELFDFLVASANKVLEQRQSVINEAGTDNYEELPDGAPKEKFEKVWGMRKQVLQLGQWLDAGLYFTYKSLVLDGDPPQSKLRFKKAKTPTRRDQVAEQINKINGFSASNDRIFVEKGQAQHLADTCITWKDTLLKRADELLHT